ncbi:RluA family pseudouridine synthase [Aquihabitans sp. G128]|uniref:RluA family pseudouridine synthase n=1 Tax=Aquihabitans sp. G128 TaxID=2849779 RepID=UPI001C235199|nr:RluA family pseudouridine synthase [Aquihabitans sp. G128]QXC62260.1 RluA family pseudouridine synthase [Aquihabitans sp. G128]
MDVLHEEVPAALDGQRIDRVVAMLTGISRTEATDLVKAGGVRADDVVASRGADRLHAGQQVAIEVPAPVPADLPQAEPDIDLPIVHVDDHVIVIDKPAELVVHPGAGHVHGTVVSALLDRFPELASVGDPERPGIVHRLDRGTSGLLMVARSAEAYTDLVAQLTARTVERRYRTLVWGHPDSPRGVVDAPIGRSPKHPTKMAVTANGKEARTRYEVEQGFEEPSPTSLVTCRLETGRTHQIRVHLSAIGHPVVGDDRYNGVRQSLPSPRPFLHAEQLGFEHPVTGEHLSFEAPLPPDLQAVLAQVS